MQLNLAQAVIHLATAPKSNAATTAIGAAIADVRAGPGGPVPRALRDAHYPGAARLGHGTATATRTTTSAAWSPSSTPPDDLAGTDYYRPSQHGAERSVATRLPLLRRIVRGLPAPAAPSAAGVGSGSADNGRRQTDTGGADAAREGGSDTAGEGQ